MMKSLIILPLLMMASSLAFSTPTLNILSPGSPAISDSGHELFIIDDIDGIDDDITSFILSRSASNLNAYGIYDPLAPANMMYVSGGAVAPGLASAEVLGFNNVTGQFFLDQPGPAVSLNTVGGDGIFGMFIDTGSNIFYSETGLNADGIDHLATFLTEGLGGPTTGFDIVFAWEDILGGGDMDYNDIITGCIDCQPYAAVPAPATGLLFGIGAAGLIASRRRKQS